MGAIEIMAPMQDAPSLPASAAQEAALPSALISAASDYIAAARAPNTRKAYARAWAAFTDWCERHGRASLPASLETVAAWMADLATSGKTPATISAYTAAVVVAHRTAGHTLDRKSPLLADVWKGIRNDAAHAQRQARPITAPDLRSLLTAIGTARPSDARDAALIALGWAGALRRSELIGLDWQQPGNGSGFVSIDERGITITLLRSKTSQAEAVTIAIPAQDMPAACAALAEWSRIAALKPGEPVFRRVDHWEHVGGDRLTGRSVARIIKTRVAFLARLRGFSADQAAELAAKCSGHSLRAGYATAAAQADLPTHRIMQHTRHKSAEMVNRYIRESDKWTKSGLQGVGF